MAPWLAQPPQPPQRGLEQLPSEAGGGLRPGTVGASGGIADPPCAGEAHSHM